MRKTRSLSKTIVVTRLSANRFDGQVVTKAVAKAEAEVATEVEEQTFDETTTRRKAAKRNRPKRQPRYHVILWDDDDHTYEYVIRMLKELFGHPYDQGYKLANTVDTAGRAVCLTTTKEHAELKVEQIHAYGKDHLMRSCAGSMSASIEPTEST